jgi:hypothetical protein
MRKNASLGADAVAAMLDRSPRAIRAAASRHRISLRRKGSRTGLLLGQPRGVRVVDVDALSRMKADVLAGRVDLTDVEARATSSVRDPMPELCPLCTTRVVDGRRGCCRVCWLRSLAAAHRDAVAESDATRELWRARQEKRRDGRA